LEWLAAQNATTFLLRGQALAVTHEVNPAKPVSEAIAAFHDRTVEHVVSALGGKLVEATDSDGLMLLETEVMNHALRKHVLQQGAASACWRLLL